MDYVSTRILEHHGVIVDYYGDGVCAMWGAPTLQPDQAALACRAALAVLRDLPALSAQWEPRIGEPLGVGIGINTGPALVGNTGSRYKFKYGPLGHTVNVASRVEQQTKHLGIPALLTGATRARIGDAFALRRLYRVRMTDSDSSLDLYELHAGDATPEWLAWRDAYEAALGLFEQGQWQAACQRLAPLLQSQGDRQDIPSVNLLNRSTECIQKRLTEPSPFSLFGK
jgi:adenylate cyclase